MKQLSSLCVVALVASMLGCQSQKTSPELSNGEYSYAKDQVVDLSVSELSKIIPTICDELGITIQDTVKGSERFESTCASLSNRHISIEVEALVKGRSNVRVTVQGDKRFAVSLNNEISTRLRSVVREYSQN
jgi:hypothetical protein